MITLTPWIPQCHGTAQMDRDFSNIWNLSRMVKNDMTMYEHYFITNTIMGRTTTKVQHDPKNNETRDGNDLDRSNDELV